jgi:N-acylneuraminate cytidylyltransferase
MNIAVIPARGGSKRIPRKNIRSFHGVPIIAYAINNAIKSRLFEKIFVSTDDEEIAEIALKYGASVPWIRPKEISDDFSTTNSVMKHAVENLRDRAEGVENVCCIYPTTPLLQPKFLKLGLECMSGGDWDYVIAGIRSQSPPERLFSIGPNNEVQMLFPEYEKTRTQDLMNHFQDAGQFYWGKTSSWEQELPIFTGHAAMVEIPSEYAVDIDTLEDWNYAEFLFSREKQE